MKIITVTPNPALDVTVHVNDWARGAVNRGQSIITTVGGKGINVAVNLANSGLDVYATGWLGRENDEAFTQVFAREKITDAFIRVDGETRQNLKVVDAKRNDNTDFNMLGVAINASAAKALDVYLDKYVDAQTVLVLGGSLPLEFTKDYYVKTVKKFSSRCHYLVVDASGKALADVLQADCLPDMVKPNIDELREVTGKALENDEQIVAEAREWVSRGIKMFIVSMGHEGAWFVTAEESVKALPLKVDVTTTVGAGDAMVAGTIRSIVTGADLAEIARTATAYSAANIENVGAGLPAPTRLEQLKSQVIIEIFKEPVN